MKFQTETLPKVFAALRKRALQDDVVEAVDDAMSHSIYAGNGIAERMRKRQIAETITALFDKLKEK